MYGTFNILKKLRNHLFLILSVVLLGALGYHLLYPDEPFHRLLYMTTITLSTVGYGDIFQIYKSQRATYYTIVLMIIGMGVVLYSISAVTALFIEGKIWKILALKKLQRRIKKMKNHFIVCGAGQTGIHVIKEMINAGREVVAIELNEKVIQNLKDEFKNISIIKGDATSDHILDEANLHHSKGIVVSLANDKDNLFLTLTARLKSPHLKIVAKAVELSLIDKLKKAGANYVVSPNFIGGLRIASEMLRPNVVGFLDKMLRGADHSVRIGEVTLGKNSQYIQKTLKEVGLFEKCQLNVLAYSQFSKDDHFIYNPSPNTLLGVGDTLIFIGTNKQQERMNELFT